MAVARLARLLAPLLLLTVLAVCTSCGTSVTTGPPGAVCGHEAAEVGGANLPGTTLPPPSRDCLHSIWPQRHADLAVTIIAATGKQYVVYPSYTDNAWDYWYVVLPPGSYNAVGWACPASVGTRFVLHPRQTMRSIYVRTGCTVP